MIAPFENEKVVLPVVHVLDLEQVLLNVDIAECAGADGVFLVNHNKDWRHLKEILMVVQEQTSIWVGVNALDLSPENAIDEFRRAQGIWADQAHINEHADEQERASAIAKKLEDWNGLYFGGVAFKYQRPVHAIEKAAKKAMPYMDVVTTSGKGTGRSANVEKVQRMKDAVGAFPLAVASGITPENVTDYLPHADCFLVATGISFDFHNLDEPLTCQLVETIHNYQSANG